MFRKIIYLITFLFLTVNQSFSQNNSQKVSTQTDKQKVVVVVPSSTVPDDIKLIEGKVILVYDGDTISIEGNNRKIYTIRLQGIDAPEGKQNYSKKSRKNLADLIQNKTVKVVVQKEDLYDRYIGNVYLDGQDIGLKQIEAGLAWHYKLYSNEQSATDRKNYAEAESNARSEKLGLWEEDNPTPPWTFRKEKPPETKDIDSSTAKTDDSEKSKKSKKSDREYIRGPRGGCYYINSSGNKTYVKNKSLCDNR